MNFHKKKLALWEWLVVQNQSVGLSDILKGLSGDYSERSVRRWLGEMVDRGLVEREGRGWKTRYKSVKYLESEAEPFSPDSLAVIERIKRPLHKRPLVNYDNELLQAYKPNVTFYMPKERRIQLEQLGNRNSDAAPAGTYARHIFNRLLIDLSFNSSRLEGNTYSLLDTEKLILKGSAAFGKLDEETSMILNHKEAIRFLVENIEKLTLSPETVFSIHYLLADGLVESRHAGKVRDHGVRISGCAYIPYESPDLITGELKNICQKGQLIKDPLEQSLFFLLHLSYLQAFSDVNKRSARLCANIPLIKHNRVPLSFNDVKREDYTSAIMIFYELQNPQPMVDLITFTYMRCCQVYDGELKAVGFDEIRVRYRKERRMLIRQVVLQQLVSQALDSFVNAFAEKEIPKVEQADFIEDVFEDLNQIDTNRILGLGITPEEFRAWEKRYTASS